MPMAFIVLITSRFEVLSSIRTSTPGNPACTHAARSVSIACARSLDAAKITEEIVGVVDRAAPACHRLSDNAGP